MLLSSLIRCSAINGRNYRAGHEVRIDHRSYTEQGIERLPGVHLGPTVQAMEARGIIHSRPEMRGSDTVAVGALNRDIGELKGFAHTYTPD